ncbi:MAG: hypothetical protein ACLP3C_30585 [Mycobacterium sp.]|uniref:hypothetical protein n=1 Tax=Mycobacterium sp. TaxID=1785 RepID=UPI003F99AF72
MTRTVQRSVGAWLGTGNSPVGAHRLGNNSALPGVVTYVCPDGEVQITVPDARWPLGL